MKLFIGIAISTALLYYLVGFEVVVITLLLQILCRLIENDAKEVNE